MGPFFLWKEVCSRGGLSSGRMNSFVVLHVYMCVGVCVGVRAWCPVSSLIVLHFTSLRQDLWVNSQLTNSASLANRLAPGTLCVFFSNTTICSIIVFRSSGRASTPTGIYVSDGELNTCFSCLCDSIYLLSSLHISMIYYFFGS